MNERYKELEKQCTKQQIDYDVGKMYDQVDHRKLAELIVKECLSIVDDAERGGSNEVWDNAVKFIRRDLKEHFGVEE